MKKNDLWWGAGMAAAGLLCLICVFLWDTRSGSLLCGFASALLFPGLCQLWRYRKWSKPENAAAYQEKLEQEQIELRDERKEMLRNKSGRYAYVAGMAVCCLAIIIFSMLNEMGVTVTNRGFVLFLSVYLLLQYAAGIWFYRRLEKTH